MAPPFTRAITILAGWVPMPAIRERGVSRTTGIICCLFLEQPTSGLGTVENRIKTVVKYLNDFVYIVGKDIV